MDVDGLAEEYRTFELAKCSVRSNSNETNVINPMHGFNSMWFTD